VADRPTLEVYEARAAEWRERRPVHDRDLARAGDLRRRAELIARQTSGTVDARNLVPSVRVVDLGCGPGGHLGALGPGAVGLDASTAMLQLAARAAPGVPLLQGDIEALPFGRATLLGAWAARSYVHVPATRLPAALADLHRALVIGAPVHLVLFVGRRELGPLADDDFPGRRFSGWEPEHLQAVVLGAGFAVDDLKADDRTMTVRAHRARTLPDLVAPGMRLLICGLNPSLYAADVGIGFARPGNRFWPAALAAGVVSRDRDPRSALAVDNVGMTDLVKRATVGADELRPDEYRAGARRLERLVGWLQPSVVCFVGLAGYRAAVDRRAVAGLQPEPFAGRPAYVMPNTSGLNARSSLATLTQHLQTALAAGSAG
jgi:TDG/mug DNA glycosylase family protein